MRERAAVWGAAAFYGAGLWILSRGIRLDYIDGINALVNALVVAGDGPPGGPLTHTRPLLSWMGLVPVSIALRGAGFDELLAGCRALMCLFAALVLAAAYHFYRASWTASAAAVLTVLTACNPLLVRYAPFLLFDAASALPVLAVVAAGWRYITAPSLGSYALFFGAYLTAVLCRYQLCLLILAPGFYPVFAPGGGGVGSRLRAAGLSPIWLAPPAAYGAAVVLLGLVSWHASSDALPRCIGSAHQELARVLSVNLNKEAPDRSIYIASVLRHLGLFPSLFAAFGLWLGLAGDEARGRYLAWSLILPLLLLSLGIANKEQRYVLAFLPLLYSALGRGMVAAAERLRGLPRPLPAVLLLALAAAPWTETAASARFLAAEPSLRAGVAADLAELIGRRTRPEGCVAWLGGERALRPRLDAIASAEQMPSVGAVLMRAATRRRVDPAERFGATGCRPGLVVAVAAQGPGDPAADDLIAEVYETDPRAPEIAGSRLRGRRRWVATHAAVTEVR